MVTEPRPRVGILENLYGSATLLEDQHIAAGSVAIGAWQDVSKYVTKTFFFYLAGQSGSAILDVSPVGSADYKEYWSDDLAADELKTASFSEPVKYARGKIYCKAGVGTASLWSGVQTS